MKMDQIFQSKDTDWLNEYKNHKEPTSDLKTHID